MPPLVRVWFDSSVPVFVREEDQAPVEAPASGQPGATWRELPAAVADVGRESGSAVRRFLGPFADLDRRRGGPEGAHAHRLPAGRAPAPAAGEGGRRNRLTVGALLAFGLATLTWLISMARQDRCRFTDVAQGGAPYHWMCYTDLLALYRARGLATGSGIYRDIDWEYPALSGYFAEWTRRLTDFLGVPGSAGLTPNQQLANANIYLAVNATLLFVCFLVIVAIERELLVDRPWLVLAVACSPAIMTAALINWDLFAVALTMLGLLAASRKQSVMAGVWLGLAIAAKFYPLVILGGLAALALRPVVRTYIWPARAGVKADGEADPWVELVRFGRLVVAAAAAWVAANLPLLVTKSSRWSYFYTFNKNRGPDLGSLWYGLNLAGFPTPSAQKWALGFMIVCYAAIALLVVLAPTKPRIGQVAFLCVAVMVTFNMVYSPQYVLWTLPLVVWALPRWPEQVAFALAELLYYFAIWLHLDSSPWVYFRTDGTQGQPLAYVLSILVRIGVTGWLMGIVARDIWWPGRDALNRERGQLVMPGPVAWPWRRAARSDAPAATAATGGAVEDAGVQAEAPLADDEGGGTEMTPAEGWVGEDPSGAPVESSVGEESDGPEVSPEAEESDGLESPPRAAPPRGSDD